jgi:hypothetical protein
MRFRAVLGTVFFAVAVLPGLALAAELQPGQMGALQAVYDFCSKADPPKRSSFDREAKSLYGPLTAQQIAALHKSSEYLRGYRLYSSVLPNLSSHDAVTNCSALASKHTPPPSAGSHKS